MQEKTISSSDILLERIDGLLEQKGHSRYWLNQQVADGKTTRVVTNIATKGSMPREASLKRIAEVLDTNVDFLLGRTDRKEPLLSEVGIGESMPRDERTAPLGAGIPLVGTGDCADLEVVGVDGTELHIERSTFDEEFHVRYVARPPALANARDIYAIYFHGESMRPRFEPGEVGLVDPRRPVGPGDYVLVQLNDGEADGVVTVIVKQLVRQSSQEVRFSQFNPAQEFVLPRRMIQHMHRILPPTELLFG